MLTSRLLKWICLEIPICVDSLVRQEVIAGRIEDRGRIEESGEKLKENKDYYCQN